MFRIDHPGFTRVLAEESQSAYTAWYRIDRDRINYHGYRVVAWNSILPENDYVVLSMDEGLADLHQMLSEGATVSIELDGGPEVPAWSTLDRRSTV